MRARTALLCAVALLGAVACASAVENADASARAAYDSFTHEIAAPKTRAYAERPNPVNSFALYDGGFAPQSIDYWASTLWTGHGGYITAFVAMIFVFLIAIFGLVQQTCRNRPFCPAPNNMGYSIVGFWTPRILIFASFFFLVLSAVGCIKGGAQLADDVGDARDMVTGDMDEIVTSVQETNALLNGAVGDLVGVPPSVQSSMANLEGEVTRQRDNAVVLQDNVQRYLDSIEIISILSGVMLLIVAVCSLVQLIRPRDWLWSLCLGLAGGMMVVAWGWFGTGIGATVFLNDGCDELGLFVVEPDNSVSPVNQYLNCPDSAMSSSALTGGKQEVAAAVDESNAKLLTYYVAQNETLSAVEANGGTYEPVEELYMCNPYRYTQGAWHSSPCPGWPDDKHTVFIANFATDFAHLRCDLNDTNACLQQQPPTMDYPAFDELVEFAEAAEALTKQMPVLEKLVTCVTVRETIEDVHVVACPLITDDVEFINDSSFVAALCLTLDCVLWLLCYSALHKDAKTRKKAAADRKAKNLNVLSGAGGFIGGATMKDAPPQQDAPDKMTKEEQKEKRRAEKEARRNAKRKERENMQD